jgi:hypothetical protein
MFGTDLPKTSRPYPLAKLTRYGMVIAILLLVALGLRLHGLAFGLPAINDPDELMFETGAIKMLTTKSANPGWFGHPATTTIYLLALLDVVVFLTGWAGGLWSTPKAFVTVVYGNPAWVILPARLAMVAFAVWSIWLTYRLGKELFDRRVGQFSALLLATSPLHVTYSQVIRSDIMAMCFMILCLLATLRVARGDGRRSVLAGSVWLALAIITKWPFALTILAMVGVSLRRVWNGGETWSVAGRRLLLFCLATLVLCFCFSPYLLLDYPVVLRNLHGEVQIRHLGATGGTPLQNLMWYARVPFVSMFGALGCALVFWGAILAARRAEVLALLAPVIFGFIITIAMQTLIWERWLLPLAPMLAVLAAVAFDRLAGMLSGARSKADGLKVAALAVAIVALPLQETFRRTTERMNDTRQIASNWARSHVPGGSTVLVEHFGFEMLSTSWDFVFPMGDAGCVDARKMLAGKISYSTISDARGQRPNVDYGTVSPPMRATCNSDYAMLTQYDRYAAEKSAFPVEYQAYQDLLRSGEIIATFRPQYGLIGGPTVRIVRFRK